MTRERLAGRNAVLEALRAGRRRVYRIWVSETARTGGTLARLLELAARRGVPVEAVERHRLDAMAERHQGVVAEVEAFRYLALGDLLDRTLATGETPLLLVLDSIQDPQNFGNLLRTGVSVGLHGVVIPAHRAVAVTPGVARASAGAIEYLAVSRVTNLARAVDALKERGLWVAGLDMAGPLVYDEADLTGPLAVVVGGEEQGISRLVREKCDLLVRLPMVGPLNSLNAAVAGSIVLYHVFRLRQRRGER